jgi:hypothetical protein
MPFMRPVPAAFLTCFALLAATSAGNGSPEAPTIVTDSPFLPPGFEPPGQPGRAPDRPQAPGEYQFRGVYQLNNQYYFQLYNVREQSGQWITRDPAPDSPIQILEFNPGSNTLSLRVDDRILELALASTSDQPLPIRTASAKAEPAAREPASKTARRPEVRRPARRRVIRPRSRTPETSSATAERRRVVRRNP